MKRNCDVAIVPRGKPLQWLHVIEEATRRTPILQHAERKECLFTDGGSTARVQLRGFLRLNNEGGNQKHWYFICKSGSDLFFFKLASLMNRFRGKSSTYSWPFYMNEQSNECTNKWISGQVCQQDYITASFDFLSYTRTKLTCRNSTVYERRTKDKGQDGGLVS